jgi:hypothetical protein
MTLVNDERAAAEAAGGPVTDHARKHRIGRAGRDDTTRVAASLALAFYDDPVFRWFSPDDRRRGVMLPHFFDVFVEAYLSHGETYTDAAAAGGALWATPGTDP